MCSKKELEPPDRISWLGLDPALLPKAPQEPVNTSQNGEVFEANPLEIIESCHTSIYIYSVYCISIFFFCRNMYWIYLSLFHTFLFIGIHRNQFFGWLCCFVQGLAARGRWCQIPNLGSYNMLASTILDLYIKMESSKTVKMSTIWH